MIDTHCHLTDPRLNEQLPAVMVRAAANGVTRMITIGVDIRDARAAIALCRQHANLRCAVGIHPNHSHQIDLAELPALRELQADPMVLAVGEIGLDYYRDHSPRQRQQQVFEFQLSLAAELGRPVVLHSREAIDDTLALLRNFPRVPAVFHCFTGTAEEARRIASAGCYLGFDGPITYKKNDALREIVRDAPPERIVIETDSPYLSPEPFRKQKVNEPGLVKYVAETLAAAKGWTLQKTDDVTTQNAEKFFGWTYP